jgi:protein TonB
MRLLATGSCGLAAIAVLFLGLSELTQSGEKSIHDGIVAHPVDFDFHPPKETLETKRNPKPEPDEVDLPELPRAISGAGCVGCAIDVPLEPVRYSAPPVGLRGRQSFVAGSDVDVQPIVRILPDYPPNGRGDGWVLVQFDVTKLGTVANARVVDASPRGVFEKNALKAIERWRYRPAVMEGQAVERRGLRVRLSFVLERA